MNDRDDHVASWGSLSVIVRNNSNIQNLNMAKRTQFAKLAWILLAYTLLVILWGAWVRISHSGDGCGNSWPLCEGQFIPGGGETPTEGKTWVEFSHRITSGLYGIFVLIFWQWARRIFPAVHPARRAARASFIFMVIEALFGAVLVRKGLVGQDESLARVIVMSLHFLNSALLMVTTTWMAAFASEGAWKIRDRQILAGVFRYLPTLAVIILGALGLTGTFAALSTTLFPSMSLGESLSKEMAPNSHFLLQLRSLHPILGVFAGSALALLVMLAPEALTQRIAQSFRKPSYWLGGVLLATISIGAITLLTMSPALLKILHLALAHLTVIALALWLKALRFDRDEPST